MTDAVELRDGIVLAPFSGVSQRVKGKKKERKEKS